jgi:glycosyltransferase involved in cell wall biosynthesis
MSYQHIEGRPWQGIEILVVSPTPTHPQDHGNRKRIFELCKELKGQGAKIHFVHYASEHDWRHDRPSRWESEMIAAWDTYQLVAPSRPLHEPAKGSDHRIDEWSDESLSAYIRWTCSVRAYDVVLVEYTWLSFCFDAVPEGLFRICDTHDVFGGRRLLLEQNGIAPEFFYTTPDEEKRGLGRADLIWAIKDSERTYFKSELAVKDCLTLLYSEPARGWWKGPPSRDGWLRVGIIGAKNNVNRCNLEAFIAAALPVFQTYMAPVKLVIAGGCSDDFSHLKHPNIEVLGRVPDVADFYRTMDVIAAPMQFSTGLKIKVSEALASGAPLIAHAHAMEGYPTNNPLHLLPDFKSIAWELVKLAFDPSRLPALAAASVITTQKIQALVIQTLEQTRQRFLGISENAMVVVAPLEALDKNSLLRDHLFSVINYLRFAGPIVLYLVGRPAKFDLHLLTNFGSTFVVYVAPKLAQDLGDALPETWRPLDLGIMLKNRGIRRGYFLASDEQIGTLWPGTLRRAYVRIDAVALSGASPTALVEMIKPITSVVVISASINGVADGGVAATCQAPFRRKNGYSSFTHRRNAFGHWGGLLIVTDTDGLLVRMLQELAARMHVPVAVLNVSEASAVRELAEAGSGADPRVNVAGARLLVDLTTTSLVGAVIIEGARRAGIPIVRLARGASPIALQQLRHVARPITIGGLFKSVAAGLLEGAERNGLLAAAQSEADNLGKNDAGWAWLWRDLTNAKAVANGATAADGLFG